MGQTSSPSEGRGFRANERGGVPSILTSKISIDTLQLLTQLPGRPSLSTAERRLAGRNIRHPLLTIERILGFTIIERSSRPLVRGCWRDPSVITVLWRTTFLYATAQLVAGIGLLLPVDPDGTNINMAPFPPPSTAEPSSMVARSPRARRHPDLPVRSWRPTSRQAARPPANRHSPAPAHRHQPRLEPPRRAAVTWAAALRKRAHVRPACAECVRPGRGPPEWRQAGQDRGSAVSWTASSLPRASTSPARRSNRSPTRAQMRQERRRVATAKTSAPAVISRHRSTRAPYGGSMPSPDWCMYWVATAQPNSWL